MRLVRGHFGTYEPIDFLALLIGYARSFDRTLSDFCERVAPFEPPSNRTVLPRAGPPKRLGASSRWQGRRSIVFDVDATRQAARKPALACDPAPHPVQRRLDAVCAPGYTGRKRGEVIRTCTTALQMQTRKSGLHLYRSRQWGLSR